MGVFNNIMLARTGAGYLQNIIYKSNKVIAIVPGDTPEQLEADVLFSYKYETPVKITKNPVENGVIVNDHRIILPQKITIEVGFNNIVGIKDILSNLDVGTLIQAGKLFVFGNRFDSASRVAAKYTDLLIAEYNGDTFDIITPLGTFKDMLITNIDSDQNSETISVFRGRITYERLITYEVTSRKITDIPGVNALEKNGLVIPKTVTPSLVPSGVGF